MILRRFSKPGDVEEAFDKVINSDGLDETKLLAKSYCKAALDNIKGWKSSDSKHELEKLVTVVVDRMT